MWASGLITWWECEETADFLHHNILLLLGPQQGRIHETWWDMQLYSWPLAIRLSEYLVETVFPCPWIKVPAGPRSWMVTLVTNAVSFQLLESLCLILIVISAVMWYQLLSPAPAQTCFRQEATVADGLGWFLFSTLHLHSPPSPAPSCCSGSVLSRVGAAW